MSLSSGRTFLAESRATYDIPDRSFTCVPNSIQKIVHVTAPPLKKIPRDNLS